MLLIMLYGRQQDQTVFNSNAATRHRCYLSALHNYRRRMLQELNMDFFCCVAYLLLAFVCHTAYQTLFYELYYTTLWCRHCWLGCCRRYFLFCHTRIVPSEKNKRQRHTFVHTLATECLETAQHTEQPYILCYMRFFFCITVSVCVDWECSSWWLIAPHSPYENLFVVCVILYKKERTEEARRKKAWKKNAEKTLPTHPRQTHDERKLIYRVVWSASSIYNCSRWWWAGCVCVSCHVRAICFACCEMCNI